MKLFVINLPEAQERMAFQKAQMARLGFHFETIVAVSGSQVDETYFKTMRASGLRLMTRNEIGCFLSHYECWRRCSESGQPVAVFEDDAVISDDLPLILADIETRLNDSAVVLSLEAYGTKKRVSDECYRVGENKYTVYRLVFAGAGAAGYVITPQAARLCLNMASKRINLADLFLYSVPGVQVQQVIPAPVMQLCFLDDENKFGKAAQTTINVVGSKRPTSFESFLANPMTRVRRLQSWFRTVWLRHMKPVHNSEVKVTHHIGLKPSLLATKRLLNG